MKLSPWQLWCISKFYRIYACTFRYESLDQERMDSLILRKIPLLTAFFHEELISVASSSTCYSVPINALAMTSASRDGDIVEALCAAYNIRTVRGSSSRGGMKALREIKRRVEEEDITMVAIAIDGPNGPRREAKPGIIYLSYLLKFPIIPCRYIATRAKILHTMWDKTRVPLPFTKISVRYGEPYYITEELTSVSLLLEQRKLQEKLEQLEK
ncbi:MAG: lysophospholipid acyltransferase family protein [Desulfovibrionaceae bacterium]